MFLQKLLKCLMLLTVTTLLPSHAFWWAPPTASTTTATPPTLHLKEIPLSYFRTYTYQPVAGNPFAAFPYYHPATGALQSPLLAGPARYEHAAYMHGGAYPMNLPQHQQLQGQVSVAGTLPQMYVLPQQQPLMHVKTLQSPISNSRSSTSTARPTTTSTSTTTTTTTTTTPPPPPPTTTAASSTSTSTTTTSAPATSNTHKQNVSTAMHMSYQPQPQPQHQTYPYPYPYPTYHRRAYMGYNPAHSYRPAYPYPDYTVYKTAPAVSRFSSHGGQIQFLPCMCPISMSSGAERPTALSSQLRSTSSEEEDLLIIARNDDMSLPAESSVGNEKSLQEKREVVEAKNGVEAQVSTKFVLESDATQNSTPQVMAETVDVQLSAPKIVEKLHERAATASEQTTIAL